MAIMLRNDFKAMKSLHSSEKKFVFGKKTEIDKTLVNCKVHVSRPYSNRACSKWSYAEYHSVTIRSKCAHNIPFIFENTNYQNRKWMQTKGENYTKGI